MSIVVVVPVDTPAYFTNFQGVEISRLKFGDFLRLFRGAKACTNPEERQ